MIKAKPLERPLYFDNHATTPLDPRVLEAMLPYLKENFGNAESVQHAYGWQAKNAVDHARTQVAKLIGAQATENVFTSGATESIHLALLGFLETQPVRRHIITANSEHKAVLEVCARAERYGHELTILPVAKDGTISVEQVAQALRPNTALVSLMHGNNEIGTLHPIAAIGELLRSSPGAADVLFHVDAAQTTGKVPIDVSTNKIDLLSISAHKLYGPKGIGALFVRKGVRLHPYLVGGGQERGLRGGTHNVPGIVGLGTACELAGQEMEAESKRLATWRDRIFKEVSGAVGGIELNGHPTRRLSGNLNITIQGLQPEDLMLGLRGIAYSSASACSAGGASHVLKAIGQDTTGMKTATARFGMGRFTSEEEVTSLIQRLTETIQTARTQMPLAFQGVAGHPPSI
jgi:cysteine desulfurase